MNSHNSQAFGNVIQHSRHPKTLDIALFFFTTNNFVKKPLATGTTEGMI
jgi:hypothetical protein